MALHPTTAVVARFQGELLYIEYLLSELAARAGFESSELRWSEGASVDDLSELNPEVAQAVLEGIMWANKTVASLMDGVKGTPDINIFEGLGQVRQDASESGI